MKDIFNFLEKNDLLTRRELQKKIRLKFGLSKEQSEVIYKKWKAEFMKPKNC